MRFTTQILSVLALVSLVAADFAAFKSDVKAIDTATTKLNDAVQKSDGTSYVEALAIDGDAKEVNTKIKAATDESKNVKKVSDANAASIIKILTGTEKTTKAATDRLVVLQPKLKKLGVAGIASGDIKDLQASVKAFGQAVLAKTPPSKLKTAKALIAKFNADLDNAAKAYPPSD